MPDQMPLPATFPELIQEGGRPMPCSVFVARALRRYRGLDDDPAYAEVGEVDGLPSWWSRAQIWDPSEPWSGVVAAVEVGGREVDQLQRHRWHKVQVWTLVDGEVDVGRGSRGHDFFVQVDRDGLEVIYESDEGHGYRRRVMTLEDRLAAHALIFGGETAHRIVALPR